MADLFGTYDKRIKITIDHTKIDADLSWFPVTVFLTSSQGEEVFTEFDADEDFDRCAFTTSDGETQLYADCELFDISESKAIYHVSKTGWTVSSSTDTDIYLYYSNIADHNTTYISKSGGTAGESVWDSNFKAVYHMQDNTTSTILDSTSNDNDGTKKGANEPIEATGKVGQGQDFDGTDDYIDIGNLGDLGTTYTAEAVAKFDNVTSNDIVVSYRTDDETDDNNVAIQLDKNGDDARFIVRDENRSNTGVAGKENILAIDTWYYLAGYRNGNTTSIQVDAGTAATDIDSFGTVRGTRGGIGAIYNDSYNVFSTFAAITICEVRISSTDRSAAWIAATYDSLWDNLLTYGSEETAPTGEVSNVLFIFSLY
jgi:hypothetical protein